MRLKRLLSSATLAFAFLAVGAAPARAALIEYAVTDLGAGSWQYDYFVSGRTFAADEGFAIFFDEDLFSGIASVPLPPSAAGDWDLLVLQPDPVLPDEGIFDALALVGDASLASAFSVAFTWLGALGTMPGAQPFEIYRLNDIGEIDEILETGLTVPLETNGVPEPSVLLLLSLGGASMEVARRLRRRAHGA